MAQKFECSICFDAVETTEVFRLSCSHELCLSCYENWQNHRRNRGCPFCRRSVMGEELYGPLANNPATEFDSFDSHIHPLAGLVRALHDRVDSIFSTARAADVNLGQLDSTVDDFSTLLATIHQIQENSDPDGEYVLHGTDLREVLDEVDEQLHRTLQVIEETREEIVEGERQAHQDPPGRDIIQANQVQLHPNRMARNFPLPLRFPTTWNWAAVVLSIRHGGPIPMLLLNWIDVLDNISPWESIIRLTVDWNNFRADHSSNERAAMFWFNNVGTIRRLEISHQVWRLLSALSGRTPRLRETIVFLREWGIAYARSTQERIQYRNWLLDMENLHSTENMQVPAFAVSNRTRDMSIIGAIRIYMICSQHDHREYEPAEEGLDPINIWEWV